MKKWGLAIMAYVLLHQVAFANQNWDQWVAEVRTRSTTTRHT